VLSSGRRFPAREHDGQPHRRHRSGHRHKEPMSYKVLDQTVACPTASRMISQRLRVRSRHSRGTVTGTIVAPLRRAFGRPRRAGPPGLIGHARGTVRGTLAAR
jgi:hypothetical protein